MPEKTEKPPPFRRWYAEDEKSPPKKKSLKNGVFPVILKENGGRREDTTMVPVNQKRDARKQWLLVPGDKLCCGNQEYTITGEPIGCGGSSVIYPAALSGSCRSYAIKECMPARFGKFCRRGGVICPQDPEDETAWQQLRQYRERLDQERVIGQQLSAGTSRVISIWENLNPTAVHHGGEVYTDVSEGIFSLLDRVDKKGMSFRELLRYISDRTDPESPLKTGGLPRIHTACRMIEQTLLALERVHEAGYLFGDIQDGNVFFADCRLERSDVGIGNLLDFGSARPLEADGKTAMIQDSVIFTTEGFTPPEILYENNGLLRLGKQADIYGVGCLLLRCVLPAMVLRMRRRELDEDDGADIGCTGDALKKLNHILSTALADAPESRYPDAPSMLQDIRTLMELVAPPKHELPRNLSAPEYFVPGSRRREIAAVLSALEQGETVFLYGVGGIGKTETAIQAAKQVQSVKGAYLIHYQTSMRHTISLLPFTGTQEEEHQEDWYSQNLRILREEYRGAVLVMDNFDVEGKTFGQLQQEQEYQDLLALDLKLVFTTRYPQKRPEWEVKPLEEGDLLKLMAYHLGGRTLPEESLLSLIREVHGHTLLLTLMAKALSRSHRLTPEALLENLRCGKLEGVAVDSGQMKLSGRQYTQKDIQSHMSALFQMTALTDAQRSVMCCAVLLPQEGMDRVLFEDALGEDGEALLLSLLDMGWLHARGTLVTIHPVIREVCRTQLQPTGEECSDFLDRLWQRYEANSAGKDASMQCAGCFENACSLESEDPFHQTDCTANAGRIHFNLGNYEAAAVRFCEAVELAEQNPEEGTLILAGLYRLAGCGLGSLRAHRDAQKYFEKALELLREDPEDRTEMAGVLMEIAREHYNLLAEKNYVSYEDPEVMRKGIDACLEARGIYATDADSFHMELMLADILLSKMYVLINQKRQAQSILSDVMKRFTARPVEDYALQFSLYRTYADIMAEHLYTTKQEGYYLKLIQLTEDWNYTEHPNGAVAYLAVAEYYLSVNRWEESILWARKALDLRERYFPEDSAVIWDTNRVLADGCYGLAHRCRLDGEQEDALTYIQKAVSLRESLYTSGMKSWKKAIAYYEAALICARVSDVPSAVGYMKQALENGFEGYRDPLLIQWILRLFPAGKNGWIVRKTNYDDTWKADDERYRANSKRHRKLNDLSRRKDLDSTARFWARIDIDSGIRKEYGEEVSYRGERAVDEYHLEYALRDRGKFGYLDPFYGMLVMSIRSEWDLVCFADMLCHGDERWIAGYHFWLMAGRLWWFLRRHLHS